MLCPYNIILGRDTALPSPHFFFLNDLSLKYLPFLGLKVNRLSGILMNQSAERGSYQNIFID